MTFKLAAIFILVQVAFGVKYEGCWKDASNRDLSGYIKNVGSSNTVQSCVATCKRLAFRYAGLQYTNWCLCGDEYGKYGDAPDADCGSKCPGEGGAQRCGGGWRNAVYSTGYEGCFRDSVTRAMDNAWHIMAVNEATVEKCLEICAEEDFKYAGLQYYKHCFCANEFERYGEAPKSECNTPCGGNSEQMCGGGWRNSVYRTSVRA